MEDRSNIIQEAIDSLKKLKVENVGLKAENEELGSIIECKNGTISTLVTIKDNLKIKNAKLQSTIAKIKEIAELRFNTSQCNCGLKASLDDILQLINESEV